MFPPVRFHSAPPAVGLNLDGFFLQVLRLEGQVCRYKSASENAEKIEDELKVEKRRLQREVRAPPLVGFLCGPVLVKIVRLLPAPFGSGPHRGAGGQQQPPVQASGEVEGQQERPAGSAVKLRPGPGLQTAGPGPEHFRDTCGQKTIRTRRWRR